MRKRKRQVVKKLIQCAAIIAAGVLAIILFMLAIWYRGRKRQKMSVEHIGNGYVKICVSEEELENSIAGLSQLKPILQTQVMKGNGRNTKQGLVDAAELGKTF